VVGGCCACSQLSSVRWVDGDVMLVAFRLSVLLGSVVNGGRLDIVVVSSRCNTLYSAAVIVAGIVRITM
jgi:hypothetical protein